MHEAAQAGQPLRPVGWVDELSVVLQRLLGERLWHELNDEADDLEYVARQPCHVIFGQEILDRRNQAQQRPPHLL
jgi:hypothetical protein